MAVYHKIGTFALVCFARDSLQKFTKFNPEKIYVYARLVMFVVQVESRGVGLEGGHKQCQKLLSAPMHIQHYRVQTR